MSTPPKSGKGLSVRVDDELHDDLAVMMSTGITASDAVKHAVSLIAWAYRNSWSAGVVPEGVEPHINGHSVSPYDGRNTQAP
ncbi:hypothetical protein [Streptomyces fulvorobeus]|uniref:Uncharacterized protein n=1 Tax=Streptomyces fulvorobeus TaxID=284028 RepID=A0A7J0C2Q9_9ACTN|nr:hypothetical protein [Streptomyces fulvorobeus]NYE40408.1 hypothetical protein [Streptomyces fulvorobeus]GFM96688.1 hypothetical protein Sfulv_14990 [Streptomyces fulvorobeus]